MVGIKEGIRELFDGLCELLWPTRCVGCDLPGTLLCAACRDTLPFIDQATACPRCGAPCGCFICTECYGVDGPHPFSFTRAVAALEFRDVAARLVVGYKDEGEWRLSALLAQLLVQSIPSEWILWADMLTYIPSDKVARKRRGFDHMEHIAGALATQTGLPYERSLTKNAVFDQRILGRAQREKNIAGAFQAITPGVSPTDPVEYPSHVLLMDDVFTTGATLEMATRTLLTMGIREVRVAVITRVW